jgi:Putative zinc-finger
MRCAQVQELLSAYHDNELGPETHTAVEQHRNECPACTQRLLELRQISLATRQLPEPIPPDQLLEKIERRRAEEIASGPAPLPNGRRKFLDRAVAFAAVAAVLLIGVAIWVLRGRNDSEHQAAADMGLFLVDYRKHPEEAQRILAAKYDGRQVDQLEAQREIHFLPAATKTLPGAISLKSMYLLKMPCCLCVQSIYERSDKELLFVFEHADEEPEWFGDRPVIKATCNSKPTCIFQCDGELAVTWKGKKRCLTVVGARSLEEIAALMSFLDEHAEANRS